VANVLLISRDEQQIAWMKQLLQAVGQVAVRLDEAGVDDVTDSPLGENAQETLIHLVGEYRWETGLAGFAEQDGRWCIVIEDGCPYVRSADEGETAQVRLQRFVEWVRDEEIF